MEYARIRNGGVGERLKPVVLKTVRLERVSGVRIPPPPPVFKKLNRLTNWTGFCMDPESVTRDGKQITFAKWATHRTVYIADLLTQAGVASSSRGISHWIRPEAVPWAGHPTAWQSFFLPYAMGQKQFSSSV